MGFQKILLLGSLRGAVVLALALSLPADLPYWWTIQSIAFGVVIFSLFVQAPLAQIALRRNKLVGCEQDAQGLGGGQRS
jgi:CPA1 family monovalent cation:H+ antiporter